MKKHFLSFLAAGCCLWSAAAEQKSGPVLYLNFDRPGVDVVKDASGYKNHGRILGTVETIDGIAGKAVYFNGSDYDRIEIPASETLAIDGDLTISMWYKSVETLISHLGKRAEQDILFRDWNWRVRLLESGPVGVTVADADFNNVFASSTYELLPADQWRQMALVYSAQARTLTLYINGFKVKEVKCPFSKLRSDSGPILLGGGSNSWNSYKGAIDEVKIYNRALSSSEVMKELVESIGQVKLPTDVRQIQSFSENLKPVTAAFQSAGGNDPSTVARLLKQAGQLQKQLNTAIDQPELTVAEQRLLCENLGFLDQIQKNWNNAPLQIKQIISYAINPLTDVIRLPDIRPADGMVSDLIEITAAKGETVPASWIFRSLENISDVRFQMDKLTCGRAVIPTSALDIRVVKCWYQADCAWKDINILNHGIRVKIPELLVHDENLVKVDDNTCDNYLKLDFPDGPKYQKISEDGNVGSCLFIPVSKFPVRDARTLQPVTLEAGEYKQFWLTVKVPHDTSAGSYLGAITVAAGRETLGKLKVKVNVLPFALPDPKTAYDPAKEFTTSIYYKSTLNPNPEPGIDIRYRSTEQIAAELKNLREHGITNPLAYQLQWQRDPAVFEAYLKLYEQAGMSKSALYLLGPESNLGFDMDDSPKKIAEYTGKAAKLKAIADKFGYNDLYIYGIDEASKPEMFEKERTFFDAAHKIGVNVFVSVAGLNKPDRYLDAWKLISDRLDLAIVSSSSNPVEAGRWHKRGKRLWMYGDPQGGVENPLVNRRNFGVKLWRDNYDGFSTYLYYGGFGNPWNDFDHIYYRDHNYVYPTADGVIDTIAWDGVRAAVDDIRYATLLSTMIRDNASNPDVVEVSQWLKQVDLNNIDPSQVRKTMIDYILKLQKQK